MEVSTYLSQLAQQIDAAMPGPAPRPVSGGGAVAPAIGQRDVDHGPGPEAPAPREDVWNLRLPWHRSSDADRDDTLDQERPPSADEGVAPSTPDRVSSTPPTASTGPGASAVSGNARVPNGGPSWADFSEQRSALVSVTDEIAELLATARSTAVRIEDEARQEAAGIVAAANAHAETVTRDVESLRREAEQRREHQQRQMADELTRHRAELDRIEIEGATRAAALRQAAEREASTLVAEARRQAFQLLAADEEVRQRVHNLRGALDQLLTRHAELAEDLRSGSGAGRAPVVDLRDGAGSAASRFEPAEGLVTRIAGS